MSDANDPFLRLVQAAPPHTPAQGSNQEGSTAGAPHGASQLVRCTAREFITEEDEVEEPLIGAPDDTLLSTGGTLLMYGKGGAGKTTLTIDAICHLASGTPWLGQTVPTPLRVILIENEGRRAALRRRLRKRHETWDGDEWIDRLELMTQPWLGFSFAYEWCRQDLADWITDFEADLVIVGPLVTIGAVGGGTPEEVYGFEQLLLDTRKRTQLEPAFWIIHHENKAGDVSGAWDRMPDTMLHVTGQGNGHTRLHFRKARESSLHDTSLNLSWNGTYSFTIDEPPEDDVDVLTRVRELFETEDRWRSTEGVRQAVQGKKASVLRALESLAESGYLTEQKGVPGFKYNARCWCHEPAHAEDFGQQELDHELDPLLDPPTGPTGSSRSSSEPAGPGEGQLDPAFPPRKGRRRVQQPEPAHAQNTDSTDDYDADIPF